MATGLYTSADCLNHVTPPGHPERVERLQAIAEGLASLALDRREAPLADAAELLRCHPRHIVDAIRAAVPETGQRQIEADTWLVARLARPPRCAPSAAALPRSTR